MKMSRGIGHGCKLTDAEFDRLIGGLERGVSSGGSDELSLRARQHLRECERCRELYAWVSEEVTTEEAIPAVYGRIRRMVVASLEPVSPLPSTRALAIRFLIAFGLFGLPIVGVLGFAGFQRMGLIQLIGVTAILALGAAVLSYSLAWEMIPGSLKRFSPWAAVLVLATGFAACIGILFPWGAPKALVQGWRCSVMGAGIAAPAAVLFWLLVRRGTPLSRETIGCVLGGFVGLFAVTVMQFSCSRQEAGHLLVWHGGVLLATTLTGILIAGAFSRFRIPSS